MILEMGVRGCLEEVVHLHTFNGTPMMTNLVVICMLPPPPYSALHEDS